MHLNTTVFIKTWILVLGFTYGSRGRSLECLRELLSFHWRCLLFRMFYLSMSRCWARSRHTYWGCCLCDRWGLNPCQRHTRFQKSHPGKNKKVRADQISLVFVLSLSGGARIFFNQGPQKGHSLNRRDNYMSNIMYNSWFSHSVIPCLLLAL